MSKFNTKASSTLEVVENHQGGSSIKLDPKLELIGILATGIETKYYETEDERSKRLSEVLSQVAKKDTEFAAKSLIYARTIMGQRTVTHLGAVELAKYLSGSELGKRFFSKRDRKKNQGGIVFRLDDMLEISACYMAKNPGKVLPNALKRGFKLALESADKYELAKYQAKGKSVSLVDLVNLVHPKPSEQMKSVFEKLMKGELKQFNTVEDKNVAAGQRVAAKLASGEITQADADKELQEAKEDNYAELIRTKKIGYLALLRNLRNILKNTSDTTLIQDTCNLLTEESFVRRSLVFPHQIDLALEILLLEFSASQCREFAKALNTAYELAIPNLVDLFPYGRTAVVIDTSGSMHSSSQVRVEGKSINKYPIDKAALIGATLSKGIGADLYQFSSSCEEIKYNPNDSVNSIKKVALSQEGRVGHGTSFESIFRTLNGKYERVFIISDLQGGDNILRNSSYQTYCNKHGKPVIYTIDIQGYGTTMFKQTDKLVQLYGYSADIYEMVRKAEVDPKAILKEIEKIKI